MHCLSMSLMNEVEGLGCDRRKDVPSLERCELPENPTIRLTALLKRFTAKVTFTLCNENYKDRDMSSHGQTGYN